MSNLGLHHAMQRRRHRGRRGARGRPPRRRRARAHRLAARRRAVGPPRLRGSRDDRRRGADRAPARPAGRARAARSKSSATGLLTPVPQLLVDVEVADTSALAGATEVWACVDEVLDVARVTAGVSSCVRRVPSRACASWWRRDDADELRTRRRRSCAPSCCDSLGCRGTRTGSLASMCGIIGVVGADDALGILLPGLERLEYRGYDSAGVAIQCPDGTLWRARAADGTHSVAALKERAQRPERRQRRASATRGGRPTAHPIEGNAHPHVDCAGSIAVIHNGIIENHAALRERLSGSGHAYVSGTDTEVLAHLVEEGRANGLDLPDAVAAGAPRGHRGLLDRGARRGHAGHGRRRPPCLAAHRRPRAGSDLPRERRARDPRAHEGPRRRRGRPGRDPHRGWPRAARPRRCARSTPTPLHVEWDVETAELGGHPDFMTKEIFEQPEAIRATLARGATPTGTSSSTSCASPTRSSSRIDRVDLVACGSSYHASLLAKYAIERLALLPCERRHRERVPLPRPVLNERTLVVGVSQSGESIDPSRHSARRVAGVPRRSRCATSSMRRWRARPTRCSTRARVSRSASRRPRRCSHRASRCSCSRFGSHELRGTHDRPRSPRAFDELRALPELVAEVLKDADHVQEVAEGVHGAHDFFFLGRHMGFPVALEGALKLKELSYLHAEGYPGRRAQARPHRAHRAGHRRRRRRLGRRRPRQAPLQRRRGRGARRERRRRAPRGRRRGRGARRTGRSRCPLRPTLSSAVLSSSRSSCSRTTSHSSAASTSTVRATSPRR